MVEQRHLALVAELEVAGADAAARADRSRAASIRPTCSTLRTRRIKMARMTRPQTMLSITPSVALPTKANR